MFAALAEAMLCGSSTSDLCIMLRGITDISRTASAPDMSTYDDDDGDDEDDDDDEAMPIIMLLLSLSSDVELSDGVSRGLLNSERN